MKQLLELIPLVIFFIAYKFYGVQAAALTLIVATIIQLILLQLIYKQITKMQYFMSISILVFGGLTAYFNDDSFLKLKVSLINGLLAIVLLISQLVFNNPLIKYLFAKELALSDRTWKRLNSGWAMFFVLVMLVNIYISSYLSQDAWYYFKAFGIFAMTLVAMLITIIVIYPEIKVAHNE